ncbi:MAG: glycosyltransferase family 2 protein [Bacteroidota bacterium]
MSNSFPYQLSISLVVYNSKPAVLLPLLNSIKQITVPVKLIVSDNSTEPLLKELFESYDAEYIFNNANLGYGKAHNVAINYGKLLAPYHLVVNPDVVINKNCIEDGLAYLNANKNVGLLMPKVLYPDGEIQRLCKLLPTPFDLMFRRFVPAFLSPVFKASLGRYELQSKDYNKPMVLNNLSGCFMLMSHEALQKVGAFDEHFFMYLEDTDLSRRISSQFQAIYYPQISIIHNYEKGSYKSKKLLSYHIQSAFYYFGKWGWFIDADRRRKNKVVLAQIQP